MTLEALIDEFVRETATTRTHLSRLPAASLGWRPHAKSYTAGGLASHIVDCVSWPRHVMTTASFEFDPATYVIYDAPSVDDLLATYDQTVMASRDALAASTDAALRDTWTLSYKGRALFTRPKAAVLREFTLNHLIHHRGQFSVYLRLLDVAVPATYGPTADER